MHIHRDEDRLVLVGDLDVRNTMDLRSSLHLALEDPGGSVVLDVRGVTSVDVVALRVIAVASRYARARGSRLVLRDAPPAVRRMLTLTRLIRHVELDRSPVTV